MYRGLKPRDIDVRSVGAFLGSCLKSCGAELVARNVVLSQQALDPEHWAPFSWKDYVFTSNHCVTEAERRVLEAFVTGGRPAWNTSTILDAGYLTLDDQGRYVITDKFLEVISMARKVPVH